VSLNPEAVCQAFDELTLCQTFGKVTKVVGLIAEGQGIRPPVGSVCHLLPEDRDSTPIPAEVVGFREHSCLLMPYGDLRGIRPGSLIKNSAAPPLFPVGQGLLGRTLDAFGDAIDNKGMFAAEGYAPLYRDPPNPMDRPRIDQPLDVGVRAINGLLTLAKGQRVGIMAGSGVGKSTLMGMMARYTKADVNVIGLVGERGREVVEFIERDLGPEAWPKAWSSWRPPTKARSSGCARPSPPRPRPNFIRDQGKDVLLMMDSVTRFAMAGARWACRGEPPPRRLHASVFRAAAAAFGARWQKRGGVHHRRVHRAGGRRRLHRTHRRRGALHSRRAHRADARTGGPGAFPGH
jgi:flagellum-specific ATP synthase